jgi:hypothetical protein
MELDRRLERDYDGANMTDNQIFTVLFAQIRAGLIARGVANATVLQKPQPKQQGVPSGISVYLTMIAPKPLGHVRRDSVYDTVLETMTHTELQTWTQLYQVNAMSIQDPADVNQLTASDILKVVRQTLQSSAFIASIKAHGLAILRVNELRNTPFVNDKDEYEYSPSFDFTLTYDELYTVAAPIVETVEYNIERV